MPGRWRVWIVSTALVALAAGSARADAIIQFDTRSSWDAATENRTVVDFNVVPDGGWMMFTTADGYVASGIRFVGYQNATTYLGYISDVPTGGIYDFGTDAVFRTVDKGGWYPSTQVPWIMVTLPLSTYAFGLDLFTYLPAGNPEYGRPVNIWVNDGTATYEYLALSTNGRLEPPAFFGVVSTNPISWVKVQAVDAETLIDNFAIGSVVQTGGGGDDPGGMGAETPEIATAILILSGLLFIRFGKKKFGFPQRAA